MAVGGVFFSEVFFLSFKGTMTTQGWWYRKHTGIKLFDASAGALRYRTSQHGLPVRTAIGMPATRMAHTS